ncbi:Ser-Thr-rich glycosyl-phosphatidyl-inositol-anchored membrane family-domain-containing protein [Echria macrotheca]|uniref:Ser-Thr-rich glycosyl-phosphatidyl-inositol-anchored membrane family-domain-containing protein n=1 Tax=Echria macrotheca TaxID=438768 RepID=A0AAJ0BGH3_9PEZI|nr:Ser-Thr-rich glycosyl-phosphatidyl-inositol-anchored membrane family-domain-containing protein [Echria macrotheca]
MRVLSLVAFAASLASAVQFTSPTANSTLTKGDEFELSWSTVDTDPTTFSIYLVNFVNWPPLYTPLAFNVETAAGAASVKVPCSVDNSWGYQLNAINGTNVYVIYAQTPKFYVGGGPCQDTTTPEPTCAAPATVTVTVSTTLSRTNHTGSGSAVTPVPTVPVSVVPSPGKCPDTIGWSSGYDHPVTLTSPPRGPGDKAPRPTGKPGAWSSKGGDFASTSTIYSTVYLDLSEVSEEGCLC